MPPVPSNPCRAQQLLGMTLEKQRSGVWLHSKAGWQASVLGTRSFPLEKNTFDESWS